MSTATVVRSFEAAATAPSAVSAGRIVLRLLPAGIAAMLVIDRMLGDSAEYFHALRLVEAWGQVLTDGGIDLGHEFIAGQGTLGNGVALAIGTTLFIVEPAVGLALLVGPAVWISRRVQARGRT